MMNPEASPEYRPRRNEYPDRSDESNGTHHELRLPLEQSVNELYDQMESIGRDVDMIRIEDDVDVNRLSSLRMRLDRLAESISSNEAELSGGSQNAA